MSMQFNLRDNSRSLTQKLSQQNNQQISNKKPIAEISIVIPCYNEARRLDIACFLKQLRKFNHLSFIFVDDGSSDDTLNILKSMHNHNPKQIDIVVLEKNCGKAEAVRQGLIEAANSGASLIGYWDADCATPLCAIQDFMEIALRYNEIDVIYGSRIQLLGHKIKRTFMRRMVSRICSFLARLAVKLPIRDTQCGAKLFRNTENLQNCLKEKFTADWLFDVELFARISAHQKGRNKGFFEYPLAEWQEVEGSKITPIVIFKSGINMLGLVVKSYLLPDTLMGKQTNTSTQKQNA